MMVALVDDRDANRRARQTMCNLKATEAGTYDDNVMGVRGIVQCSVAFDINYRGAPGSLTMADLAVLLRLPGGWKRVGIADFPWTCVRAVRRCEPCRRRR